jgi:Zn-finger nucleic acid-binding protein
MHVVSKRTWCCYSGLISVRSCSDCRYVWLCGRGSIAMRLFEDESTRKDPLSRGAGRTPGPGVPPSPYKGSPGRCRRRASQCKYQASARTSGVWLDRGSTAYPMRRRRWTFPNFAYWRRVRPQGNFFDLWDTLEAVVRSCHAGKIRLPRGTSDTLYSSWRHGAATTAPDVAKATRVRDAEKALTKWSSRYDCVLYYKFNVDRFSTDGNCRY